ncbi:class F sortase [Amycolatopsis sp. CA-230715]|uniref:class F sortase n=1 Tax=Amycolatopsis sp. CA-230715 TaxID=2745196 RepID=UPI001C0093AC|nr:class F sortase [Amycolatopsis sp. CA-230715]QWF77302.1 hypothetical protein HUW46_00694 [Amycolatopsis sp. CA-230715]
MVEHVEGEPEFPAEPPAPVARRGGRAKIAWLVSGAAAVVVAALVVVLVAFGGGDSQTAASAPSAPGAAAGETSQAAGVPAAGEQQAPPGQEPGTVRLPSGGTAKLVRKELTADGTLPIPEGLDDATWWGAKLGDAQGAALLSGHVNWKGKKGPFNELWSMKNGQEVAVVDTAGGRWVYRVRDIVTVHKDGLADRAQALFGQDGPHRLVLVTCGGEYVGGTEGYEDNRIVTADLVSHP